MDNSRSEFKLIVLNKSTIRHVAKTVYEELNRGLTFSISRSTERIVPLAGKQQDWVRVSIHGNNISLYLEDDFFGCSILEQILTSLWANLLDFGEIKLEEFHLSNNLHSTLTDSLQEKKQILNKSGPFFGTVFKPSFGLSLSEKLVVAEKFATLGGNFIKEDETYLVDKTKLIKESETIQKTMKSFSKYCFYIPNVTPYLLDRDFLRSLHEKGIRIVMVNFLIAGLPVIRSSITQNTQLMFWGHRVGYKAIEKYISMKSISALTAYCGFDILHLGTPHFWIKKQLQEKVDNFKSVSSIMKCNTLESEREIVILRLYAERIPTPCTQGA